MKLASILNERLLGGVYIKDDKSLFVISKLVQKEFGLTRLRGRDSQYIGLCLISSLLYQIEGVSSLKAQDILDSLKHDILRYASSYRGLTISDLYEVFKNPVSVRGKQYKVKLGAVHRHRSISTVISDVKLGQPVIMMFVGSEGAFVGLTNDVLNYYGELDVPRGFSEPGTVTKDTVDSAPELFSEADFHSQLVIGVDERDKCLIVRDSRDVYSYKGYLRIPYKALNKNLGSFAFISVHVDSVTELPKVATT